ncbi:MAG TPA: ATP-binding protein [Mycobacteriales bacterium]|nr:ATP-binding protein [Mycobacteriales bacterium]HWA67540.1 ATP-binding protein [Mycobacteriales bacterium]
MASIELRFSPLTAHVRTARLIALAVARRARLGEDLLDEVRLAVGETCSRAVSVHLAKGYTEPVRLRFTDDHSHFTIEVINHGTLADDPTQSMDLVAASSRALADDAAAPRGREWDSLPPGFGLAVVSGLVEELLVTTDGNQTTVQMRWPVVSAGAHALGQLSAS